MNESSKILPFAEDKLLITPKKEICQSTETISDCCGCSRFSAKKNSARRKLISDISTPLNSNSLTPEHLTSPAISQATATTIIDALPIEKESKISIKDDSSFECQSLSSWSTMTGSEGQLESIDFINFFFENFGKSHDKIMPSKDDRLLETDLTLCCSPVPWCHENVTGAHFLTPVTCTNEFSPIDSFGIKLCANSLEDIRSSSAFESSPGSFKESIYNNIPEAPVNSPNITSDLTTSSSSCFYAKTEHESTDNDSRMEINKNTIQRNIYLMSNHDTSCISYSLDSLERQPCIGQEDENKKNNKYYNNNLIFAESISHRYNKQLTKSSNKRKHLRLPYDYKSSNKVYMWLKHMNQQNDKNLININNSKHNNDNSTIHDIEEHSENINLPLNNNDILDEHIIPSKKRRSEILNYKSNEFIRHKYVNHNSKIINIRKSYPIDVSTHIHINSVLSNENEPFNDYNQSGDCTQCYLCNQGYKLSPNLNVDNRIEPSGYINRLQLNEGMPNKLSSQNKFDNLQNHFVDEKTDITFIQETNSNNFLNKLKSYDTPYFVNNDFKRRKINYFTNPLQEQNTSLLKQFKKSKFIDLAKKHKDKLQIKLDHNNSNIDINSINKNEKNVDLTNKNSSGHLSSGRKKRAAKRLKRFSQLIKKDKMSKMVDKVTMLAVV